MANNLLEGLARALLQLAPRGRFVEIPGAGHMSPVEQPESFAAAVNAWAEESELV